MHVIKAVFHSYWNRSWHITQASYVARFCQLMHTKALYLQNYLLRVKSASLLVVPRSSQFVILMLSFRCLDINV